MRKEIIHQRDFVIKVFFVAPGKPSGSILAASAQHGIGRVHLQAIAYAVFQEQRIFAGTVNASSAEMMIKFYPGAADRA